ncbi:MAG: type II secretion system protein GspM, partial [Candidatus Binatia bacterium]
EVQRVAKMQRQRDRSAQVTAQLTRLRQHFQQTRQKLIPGETPALASAQLQERIRTLATQSGLDLVTTQVMREEPAGEFRKIAVQVTLRGALPALATFLTGVEYGDWHLAVTTLEVRNTYNARLPRVTAQQGPLMITLEVGGVMQGPKTSAVAQES